MKLKQSQPSKEAEGSVMEQVKVCLKVDPCGDKRSTRYIANSCEAIDLGENLLQHCVII